jgi:hypothetical protein
MELSAPDAPESNAHTRPVFGHNLSGGVCPNAQSLPLIAAACPAQGLAPASRPAPPSNPKALDVAEFVEMLVDAARAAAAEELRQPYAGKDVLDGDDAMVDFVVERLVSKAGYAVIAAQQKVRGGISFPGADGLRCEAILHGSFQACFHANVHMRVTLDALRRECEAAWPGDAARLRRCLRSAPTQR